jgi:hypothetical protein
MEIAHVPRLPKTINKDPALKSTSYYPQRSDLSSVKCLLDLSFSFAHANGNLNQSIGDSLVATELHKFWCHWDSEFLGHTVNFVHVWLVAECRSKSVETLLGIHKTLQLSSWVVVLDVCIVLSLLGSSLIISISNSLVHLSLHLGSLDSGFLNSNFTIILSLSLDERPVIIGVSPWVIS